MIGNDNPNFGDHPKDYLQYVTFIMGGGEERNSTWMLELWINLLMYYASLNIGM